MINTVLLHDGTLDGIFTAVYNGFVLKNIKYKNNYEDNISIADIHTYEPHFFREYIEVETDRDKAYKTVDSIVKKIGISGYDVAMGVACHFSPDAGEILFGFLVRGFKIGKGVVNMLTDSYVEKAFALSRKTYNESHLFREFVRFTDVKGRLYSKIEPKCNILHMICRHFAERFPAENWIIYDAVHHIAAVHPSFGQWFLTDDEGADFDRIDSMPHDEYVDMWKLFVDTIAIEERKNERCQNNHLPKWYRKNMTEWKK
ncbi:MAG: TIGR03915 family putative DNA repair protein [Lachnospiraceae bacterium]|nr:TIGR03915 family putative DNA repair protein [Lachnospiraceae bacterium]